MEWLRSVWDDAWRAVRSLRTQRGTASVVLVSLSLGVGTTAVGYGTMSWLLNQSPPGVMDPERLIAVGLQDRRHLEAGHFGLSFAQYDSLRGVQQTFADLGAYVKLSGLVSYRSAGNAAILEFVTGRYFAMLGLRPAVGRTIGPDDDVPGAPCVVMLAYNGWQAAFAGSRDVLDAVVRVNGHSCRVVGVAPQAFTDYTVDWNGPTDLWLPMSAAGPLGVGGLRTVNAAIMTVIGRLRSGVVPSMAQQQASSWMQRLPRFSIGPIEATDIVLTPTRELRLLARRRATPALRATLLVCGIVLLAACFNVVAAFSARLNVRRSEIAMRSALGAARARILRQLLTEHAVIGVGAAAGGAVVAAIVARSIAAWPPLYLHLKMTVRALETPGVLDVRMAMAAVALGLGATIVGGLVPAIAVTRRPLSGLRPSRASWTWAGIRVSGRQLLLVAQVAVAVVLVVVASLCGRSLVRALRVDPEFADPGRTVIARIVPAARDERRREAFYTELLGRLRQLPLVASANLAVAPPFEAETGWVKPDTGGGEVLIGRVIVTPGTLSARGARFVAGRDFDDRVEPEPDSVIVNQVLATRLWPNGEPLRQQLVPIDGAPRRVVGVVDTARCSDLLSEPEPCAWYPMSRGLSSAFLTVRATGSVAAVAPAVRRVAHDIDPDAAVADVMPLDAFLRTLTSSERAAAIGSATLAGVGVLLSTLGALSVFVAVMADSERELAIRLSLGASVGRLRARVMAQGAGLAVVGVTLGLAMAYVIAIRLAGFLYRTTAVDVPSFVAGAAIVAICALWAMRRATNRLREGDVWRALQRQ
jgi:predicted permease